MNYSRTVLRQAKQGDVCIGTNCLFDDLKMFLDHCAAWRERQMCQLNLLICSCIINLAYVPYIFKEINSVDQLYSLERSNQSQKFKKNQKRAEQNRKAVTDLATSEVHTVI